MLSLSNRYQRNAAWLIQLRWVAVIGQIVTSAAVVWLFGIEIPMALTVIGLVLLTIISNVLLTVMFRNWKSRPDGHTYPWNLMLGLVLICLLYTSPSPRDLSTSRMPSSA